jgi:hypothetical protein
MRAFGLGERITIEKVIFVEIFLLTAFLLAFGWYFNREDPLFIKSGYGLINLLPTISFKQSLAESPFCPFVF